MSADIQSSKRKPKTLLMVALPLVLVVAGLWVWLSSGRYESTDNAAVQQARISVASDISGRVTEVFVADNAVVKAGDPLFRVDPEPYRLALAQAQAALAQARLQVEQLRANWAAAVAQEKVAQDDASYRATELKRQEAITGRGAGTESALDEARHNANAAQQTLAAAAQNVAAALAALGGDPGVKTDDHPMVQAALVARDTAAYNLGLTTVKAPADGVIYRADSFKTGQFVSAGAALYSLVETGDTWIEANFKETQIGHMVAGQKATVEFDTYPGKEYDAVVSAVGAGTGAEFSMLPAQNATGNWVKVTQRVPVMLRLAPGTEVSGLRTGLSAYVTIDTKASTHFDALLSTVEASTAQAATAE
ncbi:HlyD family secretion protein [Rhodobacter lacus]|uniref:HlyD family secretion protein n=1 Tax=Rhodobacter lacus TaxID=1641972 RepID=A0ABW5ADA2_9RHOB